MNGLIIMRDGVYLENCGLEATWQPLRETLHLWADILWGYSDSRKTTLTEFGYTANVAFTMSNIRNKNFKNKKFKISAMIKTAVDMLQNLFYTQICIIKRQA